MKKDPPFPKDMGPLAKDIIQRLLIKDPKKRLGSGSSGAQNVKSHPFYQARRKSIIYTFNPQKKNLVEKNNYFPSHFIDLLKLIQIHSCFEGPPSKMFDYS